VLSALWTIDIGARVIILRPHDEWPAAGLESCGFSDAAVRGLGADCEFALVSAREHPPRRPHSGAPTGVHRAGKPEDKQGATIMTWHLPRFAVRTPDRFPSNRQRRARRQRDRLALESLETRYLMLGTISFDAAAHALNMIGAGASDVAEVHIDNRGTATSFDDLVVASDNDGASVSLTVALYRGFTKDVTKVVFDGGFGDDRFTNNTAITALASGGAGNDLLIGDSNYDQLSGDAGNHQVTGGGGDDYLFGGVGNDLLGAYWSGGVWIDDPGADRMYGEDGNDVAGGGTGDDFIDGGPGNDSLFGDAGNDLVTGGADADTLFGGPGDDHLGSYSSSGYRYDDPGADTIHGEAGNDFIGGGTGSDVLYGDDGDDIIHGEQNNDQLFGWYGNDFFYGDDGDDVLHDEQGNDCSSAGGATTSCTATTAMTAFSANRTTTCSSAATAMIPSTEATATTKNSAAPGKTASSETPAETTFRETLAPTASCSGPAV
jgi:Ca2+-binding RTX toxin-like protein